jgi:hypothetical protein
MGISLAVLVLLLNGHCPEDAWKLNHGSWKLPTESKFDPPRTLETHEIEHFNVARQEQMIFFDASARYATFRCANLECTSQDYHRLYCQK